MLLRKLSKRYDDIGYEAELETEHEDGPVRWRLYDTRCPSGRLLQMTGDIRFDGCGHADVGEAAARLHLCGHSGIADLGLALVRVWNDATTLMVCDYRPQQPQDNGRQVTCTMCGTTARNVCLHMAFNTERLAAETESNADLREKLQAAQARVAQLEAATGSEAP